MPRPIAGALVIVAAAVMVSGCASSGTSTRAPSTPATAPSTTANPNEAVLRGYAAAVQAITDAEVHNDANWPALFETMVNPELGHVQAFITTEQHLGYHSQGTATVIHSEVTSISATTAAVSACVHGAVIAYQANGQPVQGNAGAATYNVENATLVPSGSTWVVEQGTAQQYPTAQQAGPLCAS